MSPVLWILPSLTFPRWLFLFLSIPIGIPPFSSYTSMYTSMERDFSSTLPLNFMHLLALRLMTLAEAKAVSNPSSPLKATMFLSLTALGYHTWICDLPLILNCCTPYLTFCWPLILCGILPALRMSSPMRMSLLRIHPLVIQQWPLISILGLRGVYWQPSRQHWSSSSWLPHRSTHRFGC